MDKYNESMSGKCPARKLKPKKIVTEVLEIIEEYTMPMNQIKGEHINFHRSALNSNTLASMQNNGPYVRNYSFISRNKQENPLRNNMTRNQSQHNMDTCGIEIDRFMPNTDQSESGNFLIENYEPPAKKPCLKKRSAVSLQVNSPDLRLKDESSAGNVSFASRNNYSTPKISSIQQQPTTNERVDDVDVHTSCQRRLERYDRSQQFSVPSMLLTTSDDVIQQHENNPNCEHSHRRIELSDIRLTPQQIFHLFWPNDAPIA